MSKTPIQTKKRSMTKNDILASLASHGLSWPQARLAYTAFSESIGNAVVNGQMVEIGKVLTLKPTIKQPRTVAQNFKIGKGQKVEKANKRIYLGVRIKYSVVMHKSFIDKRNLNWF